MTSKARLLAAVRRGPANLVACCMAFNPLTPVPGSDYAWQFPWSESATRAEQIVYQVEQLGLDQIVNVPISVTRTAAGVESHTWTDDGVLHKTYQTPADGLHGSVRHNELCPSGEGLPLANDFNITHFVEPRIQTEADLTCLVQPQQMLDHDTMLRIDADHVSEARQPEDRYRLPVQANIGMGLTPASLSPDSMGGKPMPAITDVEFREFSACHHNASRNWLVVKLNTDAPGVFGLGDASPMENEGEVKQLIRGFVDSHLTGRDPLESEVLWTAMYHDPHARGGRLAMTALAGLDIALWDLKGKLLGQPVHRLLGGAHRDRIRVYANGWYTNPGTPAQNAEEARAVVDMGYTALKFDPFGQHNYYTMSLEQAQLAQDRVAAVRQAVGPHVDILIEAHAKFNVMTAIQLGKRLEAYRPLWYEEPVSEERLSELLEVRRRVDIPIATGERLYTKFDFAAIVEAHAADVLQPDVANAGGITELKKIAAIAEAKHITVAPHNVCSPVGAQAEIELCASIINYEIQEYHAEFYDPHYFTVFRGFPKQQDGYVALNQEPGLGLELDEEEIAAHPRLERTTARGGTVRGI